jgi:hypothetical protein
LVDASFWGDARLLCGLRMRRVALFTGDLK